MKDVKIVLDGVLWGSDQSIVWEKTGKIAWMGMFITAFIVIYIKLGQYLGLNVPIPFLMLFGSVVFAAITGGLYSGLGSAAIVAIFIVHAASISFGPQTLTGGFLQVTIGIVFHFIAAVWIGYTKDRNLILTLEVKKREALLEQKVQARTAELYKTNLQLRHILETVPEGVLLLDANGRINLVNALAQKYLKLLAPDQINGRLQQLGPYALADLLAPPGTDFNHEMIVNDQYFEVIARPVTNDLHQTGWVLVLRDVTQERQSQQHIQQQERLATVGQLAAGIAHDFNNIITVITLYAQIILHTAHLSVSIQEKLNTIHQQAQRAKELIQQILDFSRQSMLKQQPLDLVPFLQELVSLLNRTLPENIQIHFTYQAENYIVYADSSRMQQIIMNLAVNARDAMPEGGQLTIDVARRHTIPPELLASEKAPGEWVCIQVADNGKGIPPAALSHIFEPFFTTKAVGTGTGLGLAQVYGIVQQHGGYIDVKSTVDKGTTFFLYLPAFSTEMSPGMTVSEGDLPLGQGQTILVVEDDPTVRQTLAETLSWLKYNVVQASNGRDALSLLHAQRDEISLVLSDVVMPEMGGIDLLHAIRQQNWTLPILLITGHPLKQEIKGLEVQGLTGWLPKSIEMGDLARLLAQTLRQT